MRKYSLRHILLVTLALTLACSSPQKYETKDFYALGTLVTITLPNGDVRFSLASSTINQLEKDIVAETEKINQAEPKTPVPLSPLYLRLMQSADRFYQLSNERFDITIATVTKAYGFPEGPFAVPAEGDLNLALAARGFENITLDNGSLIKRTELRVETGAFAKGYIVDQTVANLKKSGVTEGIVNAGGDLYTIGTKKGNPWRIAIKDPDDASQFLSVVNLSNKAVVTSGNYERFFEANGKRYTHIFDGTTGASVNNYISVSVIADTTEDADGLATVYFLMQTDEVQKLCSQLNTPVLLYTLNKEKIKLCGWETFETNHP